MAKLDDFKASSKSGAWKRVPKADVNATVRSIRKHESKKSDLTKSRVLKHRILGHVKNLESARTVKTHQRFRE